MNWKIKNFWAKSKPMILGGIITFGAMWAVWKFDLVAKIKGLFAKKNS